MRISVVVSILALATSARAEKPQKTTQPRGTYVLVDPADYPQSKADISKVIYMNRCVGGCEVNPGADDARTNTSSIPNAQVPKMLSEFGMKIVNDVPEPAPNWGNVDTQEERDILWDEVVDCVREVYRPFDVEIVEEDPGDTFHHEAMVGGYATEIGLSSSTLGVAPLAFNCAAINNVISFTFASADSPEAYKLCWTVAQETAHAFGLDHEFDCSDPMTYLDGCGTKYFRDKAFTCGEYEPRNCRCGATQNSHRKLLNVFGPGLGAYPPTVEVLSPADEATVIDGFAIFASATDVRGILKVELWINGNKWGSVEGHSSATPYSFTTTSELPDGYQDIEIKAYNDLSVEAIAAVTVLKGEPCDNAATDCLEGQFCEEGRCAWPPPTQEIGDTCDISRDCLSDLCQELDGDKLCTQTCIPGVSDQCGEGLECRTLQASNGVCWPVATGCCSTASPKQGLTSLLGFLALLYFVSGRRRQS